MFKSLSLWFILSLFNIGSITGLTHNVAIVGSSGDLGRELVYQSIKNKNLNVLGLTSKPYIFYEPERLNSFNKPINKKPKIFSSPKLILQNYWTYISDDYENLIFCTSAKPFKDDYSFKLTEKLLYNLSPKCKSISLVSAYGVGNSLNNSNLGIQIMDKLYLKSVYKAKNNQETLINNYNEREIKKFIYRPNALSYGETFIESTSRRDLAEEILNNIA